jgi:hypothetical protein
MQAHTNKTPEYSAILKLIMDSRPDHELQVQMLRQVEPAVSASATATTRPPSTPPTDKTLTTMEPGLPTPSSSTSASDRALSLGTSNRWEVHATRARVKRAKAAHIKSAHIFTQTRQMMRYKTWKMFLIASRGHERTGYVPTKQTTPALRKRRYSIDVNTADWENQHVLDWAYGPDAKVRCSISYTGQSLGATASQARSTVLQFPPDSSPVTGAVSQNICASLIASYANSHQFTAADQPHEEIEPVAQYEPAVTLPNPSRYQELGLQAARCPPFNPGVYLDLGSATIHNDAFHYMTYTQWSWQNREGWMRDESLNMAIEVLRRDQKCDDYAIGFADANSAQIFQCANEYNQTDDASYDNYRNDFRDKKWIFIVMNDAIGSGQHGGNHWSLIALDFVHQRAHYYDSMFIRSLNQRELACNITQGLLRMLRVNSLTWGFVPEWNSPDQNFDNRYENDAGACGPFVYKMIEMLVNEIQTQTDAGDEDVCSLMLNREFPDYFKSQFHSLDVRLQMQQSLVPYKIRADAERLIYQHDQLAVNGEDVILSSIPPEVFRPPPRPAVPSPSISIEDPNEAGGIRLNNSPVTWNFDALDNFDNETLTNAPLQPSEPADEIRLLEEEEAELQAQRWIERQHASSYHHNDNNRRRHRSSSTHAQHAMHEHSEDEEDAGPVTRTRRTYSRRDSNEWEMDFDDC